MHCLETLRFLPTTIVRACSVQNSSQLSISKLLRSSLIAATAQNCAWESWYSWRRLCAQIRISPALFWRKSILSLLSKWIWSMTTSRPSSSLANSCRASNLRRSLLKVYMRFSFSLCNSFQIHKLQLVAMTQSLACSSGHCLLTIKEHWILC